MDSSNESRPKDAARRSEDRPAENAPPDEERLLQVVQQYVRELEAGHHPNRQEWNTRHPDLQPRLNECLEGLTFMHEVGAAMKSGETQTSASLLGIGMQPGMPLGDFKIVREIGRGGMGIVYEAIQLSLGRRVALKTLPFAAGLDPKYLRRFRQEAQAAAQLHHANIVPVFAVGAERGVNFYAMQLIDGQSLDCIIRHLALDAGRETADSSSADAKSPRTSTGSLFDFPSTAPLGASVARTPPHAAAPNRALSRDEAERLTRLSADLTTGIGKTKVYVTMANLMAQAADALEYAHQQGIIHRDIKPANLLVDMNHNLWVADFGLAHLHSEQNLTRTGDLLGTIRYASPEQVSGQRVVLDHRTDLYSLGATFYELITLRPVFAATTRQSLLQQILNQDPVAPRSIDRSIPPELETILLKLLGKRPEERYGSAQEVADDLRRFLRNEPILAQPPSFMDRVRKWGRRHPSYVAALVIVMFALVVISGVSNYLIAQANLRAKDALSSAQSRAEEAERNLQQARQAVDYMIQVSDNNLANAPMLQPLQKRVLETALIYYQEFITDCRVDSQEKAELMAVQQRLRRILDEISVIEGAGQLILLGEKDVQADLMLDDAERRRFDAIAQTFAEQRAKMLRGYQNLSLAERRARFVELARASEHATQSVLNDRKIRRLKQIFTQLQGVMAFSQPEIADALKLTGPQQQAIRQIMDEAFMRQSERPESADKETRHAAREAIMRSVMDKCLAQLTPAQLLIWKDLVGRPFQGRISVMVPGMLPPP
jgi:eukaryotic-like serine/threonine-protein kinase